MDMYTLGEFAKKTRVTVHTLQWWDREGRLIARRTHTNRRYYTDDDVQRVLGQVTEVRKEAIMYCRLDGLRNYGKALKKAFADDPQPPDTAEPNA